LPFLDFAQSQDYPHTLLCLILSARRKKDNIHLSTIFTMQQKHIKYLVPGTQLTKILNICGNPSYTIHHPVCIATSDVKVLRGRGS